jgi:hypothetical protein
MWERPTPDFLADVVWTAEQVESTALESGRSDMVLAVRNYK